MKQIKKICIFSELLFCIAANAQQEITSLSPIPDATKQTIEQYISTHPIDEMNKDTVVLSNIYSLIGYSYEEGMWMSWNPCYFVLFNDSYRAE